MKTTLLSILSLTTLLTACGGEDSDSTSLPISEPESLELIFSDPIQAPNVEGVKFANDVKYGEHANQRFDIYMPASDTPTGLLLFFHGGGFTGGNEDSIYDKLGTGVSDLLAAGYAVATATYQLIDGSHFDGVKRSLNDTKYALQFIRHHSGVLNINKEQIVLAGGSAGASSSLWIGLQDDMADASATDPVLSESTRVKGIAITETQSTLNTSRWNSEVFAEYNISDEDGVALGGGAQRALLFYGVIPTAEALADPLSYIDSPEIQQYRADVDNLSFITSDDPELWVSNTKQKVAAPTGTGSYFHHAYHAKTIQVYANNASVPGVYYYGKNAELFNDESQETQIAFILRKLAE